MVVYYQFAIVLCFVHGFFFMVLASSSINTEQQGIHFAVHMRSVQS